MAHTVSIPTAPFRTSSGTYEIHQVPVWEDNLVWLLACTDTGKAAAIDGPEAGPVLDYCTGAGLELVAIFNTHIHGDHIGINKDSAKRGLLDRMRVVGAAKTKSSIPGLTEAVEDGDSVSFGAGVGRVLLTEGHIDGHISYVFDDVVFCGDTLFGAGCGYLFDGPPSKMYESLHTLSALPPSTRVCCAHEYTQDNLRFAWSVESDNESLAARIKRAWAMRARGECTIPSTVELERQTNPFLRPSSPSIRQAVRSAFPDRSLETDQDIFAATRALKDRKDYKRLADEDLPI